MGIVELLRLPGQGQIYLQAVKGPFRLAHIPQNKIKKETTWWWSAVRGHKEWHKEVLFLHYVPFIITRIKASENFLVEKS